MVKSQLLAKGVKNDIFTLQSFIVEESPESMESVRLLDQASTLITDSVCALRSDQSNNLQEDSE